MADSAALAPPAAHRRWVGLLLLVGLSFVWGLNWPAMKVVLAEMPLLSFRAVCLWLPGPLLLALASVRGERVGVPPREQLPLALVAFFNITLWHFLTALGVSLIEAGRASIIAFTMPVWATLLAAIVLREKLTPARFAGLFLGMAGLAFLLAPDVAQLRAAPLGALAILGAAMSWAVGTVAVKRFRWTISVTQLTGWQLIVGGVPIVVAAVLRDDLSRAFALEPTTALVLLYILAGPMMFAQWAWFKVLRLLPAGVAAIGTLAVPIIGFLSSAILLGEPIGLGELVALGLVVAALVLVLLVPARGAS